MTAGVPRPGLCASRAADNGGGAAPCGLPWGIPCPFDVVQAGVAAHGNCTFYTNLTAGEHLGVVLHRTRAGADRSLGALLSPGKQPAGAQPTEPLPYYPVHIPGQRLEALPADLSAAPLRRVLEDVPCYPDVEEWERIFGHRCGVATELPTDLVVCAYSEPEAPPTVACVLTSAFALQCCGSGSRGRSSPPPSHLCWRRRTVYRQP